MPECIMVQIVNENNRPQVEVIDVDGACCLKVYSPDTSKSGHLLVMLGSEAARGVGEALVRLSDV